MKVAIVCDWLVSYAGAERVLEQILNLFPQADVFAVIDVVPMEERAFLQGKATHTSFLQGWPKIAKWYRNYLPVMPLAIEQLDVSGYDLILSSSHAVAKGILTGPNQIHISYIHSPIRYAWDLQHQYLKESGLAKGLKGWIAKCILHYIRMWDYRTAHGVDVFIANSNFIARRVKKAYGKSAQVIYPPVNIEEFSFCEKKEEYYLTVSRMVPYKKIDLIVEAFSSMPKRKLIVIGAGPEFEKIRDKAGADVELLGHVSTELVKKYMQQAKAFVFAAEEDFGIAPVEAQACGTPVIAYGKGGVLDTIRGQGQEKQTGVFFYEQTVKALIDAVEEFENGASISFYDCRENALQFSIEAFRERYYDFVMNYYEKNKML